ncbi:hypothetical protein QU38_00540, partial [Staphylococcus aureus]
DIGNAIGVAAQHIVDRIDHARPVFRVAGQVARNTQHHRAVQQRAVRSPGIAGRRIGNAIAIACLLGQEAIGGGDQRAAQAIGFGPGERGGLRRQRDRARRRHLGPAGLAGGRAEMRRSLQARAISGSAGSHE